MNSSRTNKPLNSTLILSSCNTKNKKHQSKDKKSCGISDFNNNSQLLLPPAPTTTIDNKSSKHKLNHSHTVSQGTGYKYISLKNGKAGVKVSGGDDNEDQSKNLEFQHQQQSSCSLLLGNRNSTNKSSLFSTLLHKTRNSTSRFKNMEQSTRASFLFNNNSNPTMSSGNGSMTMGHRGNHHPISTTLNPKRVSVATSTFWEGPEMAQLINTIGYEFLLKANQKKNIEESSEEDNGKKDTKFSFWNTDTWAWGDPPAVKKGILIMQREKLLSRWKERYCILTRDYLHCFRRTTSTHKSGVRLSEMGSFIYKLRLADIENIELDKRRTGSIIVLSLPNEPKVLLKLLVPDSQDTNLKQWFTLLTECLYISKERRTALKSLFSNSGTHQTNSNNLMMTMSRSLSEESSSGTSSILSADYDNSPVHTSSRKSEAAETHCSSLTYSKDYDCSSNTLMSKRSDFSNFEEEDPDEEEDEEEIRRISNNSPIQDSILFSRPNHPGIGVNVFSHRNRNPIDSSTFSRKTGTGTIYSTSRHSTEISFREKLSMFENQ